jgi:hypothetical protein
MYELGFIWIIRNASSYCYKNLIKRFDMKNIGYLILIFVLICTSCITQESSRVETVVSTDSEVNGNTPLSDIDRLIIDASEDIINKLPQNARVAIYNMSTADIEIADYILEQLSIKLVSSQKIIVVDRSNLEALREENSFQLSGDVDDDQIISIGHLSSAQSVISIIITGAGNNRRCIVRTLDVLTGSNQALISRNIRNTGLQSLNIIATQINNMVNNGLGLRNPLFRSLYKNNNDIHLALIEFTDIEGNNNSLGKFIIDNINGVLLNEAQYTILPAKRTDQIIKAVRAEMEFQRFGSIGMPDRVWSFVGRQLASNYIIFGRMAKIEQKVTTTIQLIFVDHELNDVYTIYSSAFDLEDKKYIEMFDK